MSFPWNCLKPRLILATRTQISFKRASSTTSSKKHHKPVLVERKKFVEELVEVRKQESPITQKSFNLKNFPPNIIPKAMPSIVYIYNSLGNR